MNATLFHSQQRILVTRVPKIVFDVAHVFLIYDFPSEANSLSQQEPTQR